ncbi:thiamine pyrophosphate-dependent dehydrogenase E1 component subunit alpha [Arenibaculum sp.]|jgi:pyruvate dehydrogenase E1 component alpha subunit|uniref:thiamine pyrophosphate-dependent dehydrogenase E1 component subunit alpha n=1 Tax=Arenibaculum sp. TaxID=2865862 RepID=UPI002E144C23|nr:thiamine pyrophosphate-dependent dehydrogenase E1 component subunit alpha [Arenibaculum sp.]
MVASQTNRENSAPRLLDLYRTMVRIRAFELACEAAHKEGKVTGAVHLSIGQEAAPTGVCSNLRRDDVIASTHRGHGHTLAKGAAAETMMAELYGRATGCCGGKGGSMHIADFSVGMLGANGVVGAGIPIIVGAAQGLRLRGSDAIAVGFFGDGATNRGPFYEGLNWAAAFGLPVLFVCEDNGWAATTRTTSMSGGPGIAARAEALGVPTTVVDGNDVEAVDEAAASLIAEVRGGGGPRFLLCETYRLKGHTVHDAAPYRDPREVEERWTRDPLRRARDRLLALGVGAAEIERLEAEEEALIAAASASAEAAPWPLPAAAFDDVQDNGGAAWAN